MIVLVLKDCIYILRKTYTKPNIKILKHYNSNMLLSYKSNTSFITLLICLFTFFINLSHADVAVVLPIGGRTFEASDGSVPITIGWIDDQSFPDLSKNIKSYTISLVSGPNSKIEAIAKLAAAISPDDITLDGIIYKYTLSIPADVAASGVFFIQVFATGSFGYTIHYSDRFTITGLTGTITPTTAGAVTTPPDAQYSIHTGTSSVATINSASFKIPYYDQSGVSKFAPMQTQPHGSVTNPTATWTRRFPTSSVSYFTSAVPGSKNTVKTTITPGWSYVITSDINYQTGTTKTGTGYDPKNRQTRTTKRIV